MHGTVVPRIWENNARGDGSAIVSRKVDADVGNLMHFIQHNEEAVLAQWGIKL